MVAAVGAVVREDEEPSRGWRGVGMMGLLTI